MALCNVASAGIVDTAKDTVDAVKEAKEIAEFVYDLVTQKCWLGNWEVASDEGKPVKNWKHSNRISTWINITGFKKESVINGTRYINGSGKDHVIIKRYAKYKLNSGEKVKDFNTTLNITDSIINETSTTTATQKSVLKYKKKITSGLIPYWVARTERLTVSCTVEAPNNFTTQIQNVTAYITVYNRTIAPVTHVYVPNENHSSMKDVMIVRYQYNGSNTTRYDQVGWVMKNPRGAEFVGFVDAGWYPTWVTDENQSIINHCGSVVAIFDPKFNISLLNILLHTPYETKRVTDYHLKIVNDTVILHVPIIKMIIIVIASVFTLITIWRRVL